MFSADDFVYSVSFSQEDNIFVGKIDKFPSLSAHGETREEALKEIKHVVQFVLEDLDPEELEDLRSRML